MADSTVMDVTKMKVVDLRKELKNRGLSYTGDKAELVARLQAAISQDEHGDINLDSDEIDSDGVLEDEDDKGHADILDETAEELALADQPPATKTTTDAKPQRTLKRKITATTETSKENSEDSKSAENKDTAAKKIVLNRAISITSVADKHDESESPVEAEAAALSSNKVRITADLDSKSKLELRAKRFGLPVKMSDDERKEARKQRFGQTQSNTAKSAILTSTTTGSLSENMEKLRKRAERFGQSVSKIMTDIEKKEKLEKRKAKFGTVA